jgi:uncharacterized protein YciI
MSRRLSDHYVYRLIPPRPTFQRDMTYVERAVMARHAEYLTALVERADVVVYGPVVDATGSWGLAVIHAGSQDAVRALADADPRYRRAWRPSRSGRRQWRLSPTRRTSDPVRWRCAR